MLRPRGPLVARGWCGPHLVLTAHSPTPHVARRHVTQVYKRDSSLTQQAIDAKRGLEVRRSAGSKAYKSMTPLWPSTEALERDLTEFTYAPQERLPPQLTGRAREVQTLVLEGDGAASIAASAAAEVTARDAAAMDALMDGGAQWPLSAEGGEEAGHRARQLIEEDLSFNTAGVATWEACGLDPLLSELAARRFGPTATHVQSRLLPALLADAHNDVIMNGVTGSGKTAALLLAALQGIRNETAGFNVLLAANSLMAKRMFDTITSICGELGGEVVDRAADDMTWVHICEYFEHTDATHTMLKRSLAKPTGSTRLLITTADVFAELLFEHKLEFAKFGFLRRVYADDAGAQMDMVSPTDPLLEVLRRSRDPVPLEFVFGTLHQMPGPNIRSVLQLAAVSADVDTELKDHIKALCIKPHAHTIILSPMRLPTTLHCVFSFPVKRLDGDLRNSLVRLLRNAFPTIPGHCVIFVRREDNMLETRLALQRLGMDAKLLHEVYEGGTFRRDWKFLLLHEDDAPGLDIPFVSHVVITFCPSNRFSFLHMAGRVGRLGNVGWVYLIADRTEAKSVATVVGELDVNVVDHTVTPQLAKVPAADVHRWVKEPELWGLDPQFVVERHYESLENPTTPNINREFWDRPVEKLFQMEDYTPIHVLQNRLKNARGLHRDVQRSPEVIDVLQRRGYLDKYLRPTKKLEKMMTQRPGGRDSPSPYGRHVMR